MMKRGVLWGAAAVAAAAFCGVAVAAPPTVDEVRNQLDLVEARIVHIPLDARTPGVPVVAEVPFDGVPLVLDLTPYSVRTADYTLYRTDASGKVYAAESGPERSLRGKVQGMPGSRVTGALLEEGLYAKVTLGDGDIWWLEPISQRFAGADPDHYVLYRGEEKIPSGKTCGNTNGFMPVNIGDEVAMHRLAKANGPATLAESQVIPNFGQGGVPQAGADAAGASGAGTDGVPQFHIADLAIDTDFEYFQDWGNGTEARINLVIGTMNDQYEEEVGITHLISAIIVRDNSNDPYTSTEAGALLNQFRNEWLQNQPGIPRDCAQLFTGKSLQGSTIGLAWNLGVICSSQSFCLVQSDCCCCPVLSCATDLSAHELGHLWGASHCDCTAFTMNPFITCANQFNSGSESQINAEKNSVNCLVIGNPDVPDNDDCSDAGTPKLPGTYEVNNLNATTDGPDHSGECDLLTSDVWFRLGATGTGLATVDFCGVNFDTIVAVYGTSCPTLPSQAIACNDDFDCDGDGAFNDDGNVSRVQFLAEQGKTYLLRVGGFNGDQGFGTFTYSILEPPPPPPANDNCANAFGPFSPGGPYPVDTENATTDGPDHAGECTLQTNDVWYTLSAPVTGIATVDLCGATFDTIVTVYGAACPASPAALLACNDDFDCNGNGSFTDDGNVSRVQFFAQQGQTYRLRVGGFNGAEGTGSFTYSILEPPPLPPANDNCTAAVGPLLPGGPYEVDNVNATTDGPAQGGDCGMLQSDVWFELQANETGTAIVDFCGIGFDTVVAAYSGVCPATAGNLLACNNDFDCDRDGGVADDGSVSQLAFEVTKGQVYLLRVGGFAGAEGEGSWTWSIDVPPPPKCPLPDLNGDLVVDSSDLNLVLSVFGEQSPNGDTDGDGDTDSTDLNNILAVFGEACEK